MTFFFQLPPIFIEIETTEGIQFACRLIPSLSQADFIINPLLIEPRDWLNWYLGLPLKKLATVKIRTLSRQSLFQPMMNIKVSEEEGLVPYPIEDELRQTLLKKLGK